MKNHFTTQRTTHPQAQEALRESSQLNAQIVSSIQEGIIVYDRKLNFRFWNPEMEKITGYAASEVLSRNLVEVFPLFRNLAIRKQLLNTLKTNETTSLAFEYRIPEKGRAGWVSQWNAPLRNSTGRTVGIICNVRDITRQKQFEEQRDRLAAIVDSANDGIIGKTLDDIVVSFNTAAERIYGYSAAEIVGQSIARVIPTDRRQELQRIHNAVARGESMEPFETVRVTKDGRHIDVWLTASPVKNSDGRVIGISTIVRDITERKRLEEQLRRSQKMEAIGQLAAGLAHDFNNLIAVIRANASLLQLERDKLGPEAVECVAEMVLATENASKMVRQLLDFGRKRNFHATVLDLNPQIERLGKTMQRILGEKIDLQFEPAPALPRVLADVGLLEQVLLNLVINARDAMQSGGKLHIKTEKVRFDKSDAQAHPEARAGEFVRLSFIDTGTGIAPAHLPRIFEPFFTTKDPGKGVGLGLPTVCDIVRQHKGWIEVSSQWGAGSAFELYIPVAAPTNKSRPRRIIKSK